MFTTMIYLQIHTNITLNHQYSNDVYRFYKIIVLQAQSMINNNLYRNDFLHICFGNDGN